MAWFPSAALNDYIQWETMDAHTAKATFTIQGKAVSGIFKFSDTGETASFSAEKYYRTTDNMAFGAFKKLPMQNGYP